MGHGGTGEVCIMYYVIHDYLTIALIKLHTDTTSVTNTKYHLNMRLLSEITRQHECVCMNLHHVHQFVTIR